MGVYIPEHSFLILKWMIIDVFGVCVVAAYTTAAVIIWRDTDVCAQAAALCILVDAYPEPYY